MKYSLDSLIKEILGELNSRQHDIVQSRYGIANGQSLTLAAIGNKYGITRERVRQIESLAMLSVTSRLATSAFSGLVKNIKSQLEKSGGLRKEDLFSDQLKSIFSDSSVKNYKNKVFFILDSCDVFKYYPEDNSFYSFWCIGEQHLKQANDFIAKLTSALENNSVWPKHGFSKSFISVSKKFGFNEYKDFGLSCWSHICPKTSKDWAYLVLKKESKPMHFTQLSKAINFLRKDKNTNPQTVHNELIKDNRFVLVGRGTYGLAEFNILPGTAREVIAHILKQHGPQTSKNVIQLVLKKRIFKENTLLLNLQDRKYFQRLNDGKYTIKKA